MISIGATPERQVATQSAGRVPDSFFYVVWGIAVTVMLFSVILLMTRPNQGNSAPIQVGSASGNKNLTPRIDAPNATKPATPNGTPKPTPKPSPSIKPPVISTPAPSTRAPVISTPAPSIRPPVISTPSIQPAINAAVNSPTSGTPVAEWNFRYVDAGNNTQGAKATNGQKMKAGDVLNSSPIAPPKTAGKPGNSANNGAKYVTYDPQAEGIAGRPGADGFAFDSSEGHPMFQPDQGELATILTANKSFSAWARVKRTAVSGVKSETILKHAGVWRFGVTNSKIDVAFGPTLSTDQEFPVGQWRDIGVVYNDAAATVTVYVDGADAGTYPTKPLMVRTTTFEMGSGPPTELFMGVYDRVLFWDHVMDAQTMKRLTKP